MKCAVCATEDAYPHSLRAAMIAAYYRSKNKYTDAFMYARLLEPVANGSDDGLACAACITGESPGALHALASNVGLAVDDYMPTWPQANNAIRLYGRSATKKLLAAITAVHPNAGRDRYTTVVTRRVKKKSSHVMLSKVLQGRHAVRIKKAGVVKHNEQRDGHNGPAPPGNK